MKLDQPELKPTYLRKISLRHFRPGFFQLHLSFLQLRYCSSSEPPRSRTPFCWNIAPFRSGHDVFPSFLPFFTYLIYPDGSLASHKSCTTQNSNNKKKTFKKFTIYAHQTSRKGHNFSFFFLTFCCRCCCRGGNKT